MSIHPALSLQDDASAMMPPAQQSSASTGPLRASQLLDMMGPESDGVSPATLEYVKPPQRRGRPAYQFEPPPMAAVEPSSSLDSDDDSHPLSRNDLESFSVASDTTSSLAKATSSVPALARQRENHHVELPGRYLKESAKSEAANFDGLFDSVLNGDDW
ncbi:hypothetical protein L198_01843 [Cryptococcus wingfieldii CBS 7118]|uniref:Uncharacterized protein n=1 Tax=Cryptococcus wingfieldii CBS 7118 TaxID=1295528 RepID=A0A1E3JWD3_9TREE|nr:hypothetical protein L198_01843 [Cryptococcus wingfieldii CBS 7118]ODO05155.1 hypothetical protein L198_01843 [Cryptococcus wingfieldii CBS 7118]